MTAGGAAAASAAVAGGAVERTTYAAIVWAQLRKNRVAVLGLWCILGLFLLAVYAPFVSMSQPILYHRAADGAGGGAVLSFPLFPALFNRLLFESSVDVFFNLALVLSPVTLAVIVLTGPASKCAVLGRRPAALLALLAAHALLFAAIAPERFGPFENPLHQSQKIVDHRAEVARLRAEGRPPLAVFPLRPFGYRETDPGRSVTPPGREHWLGTDTEGRDVFARMLYGTRISLTIGVIAVAIYVGIGIVLGALAGYFGGWVDVGISRLIEIMICFPSFFLILTLAALVEERSIFHVMIIIGVTSWPGVARLIRAEFLKHKSLEYAQAAVALGIRRRRIIFGHILPNAIAPVLVTATFGIAAAILVESSLSFLGIGDLSVASWGETLNTGRVEGKLWLILAPGLAIFSVVTIFNLVGEGLRDALDPKLRS